MRGTNLAQQCHVANVIDPVDFTGGKTGRWLALKQYEHITFLLSIGVSAAAPTAILVKAATNNAGAGAVAIPFDLYAAETAGVDLLGPRLAQTAAGYTTISANDGIFYVIELDAAAVLSAAGVPPAGEPFAYVTVNVTNGANSVIASCVAILSGARYGADQSPSVNV
jgi:hypothetical protein